VPPPEIGSRPVLTAVVGEAVVGDAHVIVYTGVRNLEGDRHKTVKKNGKLVMSLPYKP